MRLNGQGGQLQRATTLQTTRESGVVWKRMAMLIQKSVGFYNIPESLLIFSLRSNDKKKSLDINFNKIVEHHLSNYDVVICIDFC